MIAFAIAVFVTGIALTLAERHIPARPRRRLIDALARELPYIVFAGVLPAIAIGRLGAALRIDGLLGSAPFALQWLAVLLIAELCFYGVHRAMHRVAWLWRLHRVHHTPDARSLDWVAGYRKHVGEAIVHGLCVLPFFVVLAPAPEVLAFHTALGVALNAFIHANIDVELGWLERVIVTPRYHAWHHATDERAQRGNLAAKLAFLDRWFGTRHAAVGWPEELGLGGER